VAEEDLLKWWTAEEQRVGKEEEEAVRATISTASEELGNDNADAEVGRGKTREGDSSPSADVPLC